MNKCFADVIGTCTVTQVEISRRKALRRLKSLDKPTRMAITEKYGVEGIV